MKVSHHSFAPIFNRCIVFETSEISFHGVTPVTCPDTVCRKSFAAYYYTKEAPPHWDGAVHSTNFRARPDEVLKGNVLMPLERAGQRLRSDSRDAASDVGACRSTWRCTTASKSGAASAKPASSPSAKRPWCSW